MYRRVIPRDLFNESKLLKCMGRLSILSLKGEAGIVLEYDDGPFDIEQDASDGGLFVKNIVLRVHGKKVDVKSCLNSMNQYPLEFSDMLWGVGHVFDCDGTLSLEFHRFTQSLAPEGQQ